MEGAAGWKSKTGGSSVMEARRAPGSLLDGVGLAVLSGRWTHDVETMCATERAHVSW